MASKYGEQLLNQISTSYNDYNQKYFGRLSMHPGILLMKTYIGTSKYPVLKTKSKNTVEITKSKSQII